MARDRLLYRMLAGVANGHVCDAAMDSDEDWNSSRPSSAASEAMYFGALLDVDMRRPHDHGDVDMRLSGYGFPQVREVENEEQGMSPISNGCRKS
ncbi:hypothetical protein FOCC_FOCC015201, partial [Frankliniella occidentalis]